LKKKETHENFEEPENHNFEKPINHTVAFTPKTSHGLVVTLKDKKMNE